MPDHASWNYPSTIWFGAGRIAELSTACSRLSMTTPLFVTDRGLADLPMVRDAVASVAAAGLAPVLFGDVQGNPTLANVEAGLRLYRERGCHGVIGFGGGSALDVAKCIALMAGQKPDLALWQLEDVGDNWRLADPGGVAPLLAVPTTAGTGSEVGRAAVISDSDSVVKRLIFHPKMQPELVISDPALTVGLPPNLTAWTGVDALVHAMEAYCAPSFHPMADGIAVEAIRLVFDNLPRAVADGTDLDARGNMLVAASMGATAFQKGLGSIHSVAHQLGAMYDLHHGLCNAVLLPYGLSQNRAVLEPKMAYLCRALNLEG
ncbi:MAG: iron-containing alcohol dehydrogenase, partial [Pseudomonadota bacterium]